MENILIAGISALLSLFNPAGTSHPTTTLTDSALEQSVPLQYTCKPFKWLKYLAYRGSTLYGTIAVECAVKAENGGGLVRLRDKYLADLPTWATVVNAGPIAKKAHELDGTYFDLNFVSGEEAHAIRSRNDVTVATDEKTVFFYDQVSKGMSNSGDARYIKKIDKHADLRPAPAPKDEPEFEAGQYTLNLTSYVEFEKPFLIPGGLFQDKVRQAVEGSIVDEQKVFAAYMGANL